MDLVVDELVAALWTMIGRVSREMLELERWKDTYVDFRKGEQSSQAIVSTRKHDWKRHRDGMRDEHLDTIRPSLHLKTSEPSTTVLQPWTLDSLGPLGTTDFERRAMNRSSPTDGSTGA
jgi:hypothetical protein